VKRPTVLELEAALKETADSLLVMASTRFDQIARQGQPPPQGCGYEHSPTAAPYCFVAAAQAFAAYDLLGYDAAGARVLARELRPWAGAL
jgi:hypothetical protein